MKSMSTACSLVLVAAVLAAVFELDSALVLGLLLTAGAGGLVGRVRTLTREDDRYRAYVEAHRRLGDPPSNVAPDHSRWVVLQRGALALGGVLGLGGLAVLLNSPLPVLGGMFLVLAGTAIYCHRHRHRGRVAWREFAAVTDGLDHDGGDLLNRWQPEHLQGQYRQRSIRLSPIHRYRSSTNCPARLAVTAELRGSRESLCWDSSESATGFEFQTGPLARNADLAQRLAAVAPSRLTVSDGCLSLHTPRLPQTPAELRFFCELICDLAQALEA